MCGLCQRRCVTSRLAACVLPFGRARLVDRLNLGRAWRRSLRPASGIEVQRSVGFRERSVGGQDSASCRGISSIAPRRAGHVNVLAGLGVCLIEGTAACLPSLQKNDDDEYGCSAASDRTIRPHIVTGGLSFHRPLRHWWF